MMEWLRKIFFGKTEAQIREEVYREPKIRRAREGLKRVDHILQELQALEGKRR